MGIIDYDKDQTPDNHFTITRFFKGEIPRKKDADIRYYPDYRLPNLEERVEILTFSDSLDNLYFNKHKKQAKNRSDVYSHMICEIPICLNDTFRIPFQHTMYDPFHFFPHLRGNVCEWSAIPGVAFGGSWMHSKEEIKQQDVFEITSPNAWTGFRNIARWKEWKEE